MKRNPDTQQVSTNWVPSTTWQQSAVAENFCVPSDKALQITSVSPRLFTHLLPDGP